VVSVIYWVEKKRIYCLINKFERKK
jgi:hypothetical protein